MLPKYKIQPNPLPKWLEIQQHGTVMNKMQNWNEFVITRVRISDPYNMCELNKVTLHFFPHKIQNYLPLL